MSEQPKGEESWNAWAAAQEDRWRHQAAAQEERLRREVAAEQDFWQRQAAGHEEEVIRQNKLMYGGLIGVGIVMMQPFLAASTDTIDLSARICLIAFSISVPLLATLVLLNRQETYRRRMANTRVVQVAQQVALGSGFIGVVAGFWHIFPAAGITVLVFGVIGLFIHASGYRHVELEHAKAARQADDPRADQEGQEGPEGQDRQPSEP